MQTQWMQYRNKNNPQKKKHSTFLYTCTKKKKKKEKVFVSFFQPSNIFGSKISSNTKYTLLADPWTRFRIVKWKKLWIWNYVLLNYSVIGVIPTKMTLPNIYNYQFNLYIPRRHQSNLSKWNSLQLSQIIFLQTWFMIRYNGAHDFKNLTSLDFRASGMHGI